MVPIHKERYRGFEPVGVSPIPEQVTQQYDSEVWLLVVLRHCLISLHVLRRYGRFCYQHRFAQPQKLHCDAGVPGIDLIGQLQRDVHLR